jgi:L-ascorbate metabolism protein UlaG (beta-lactamase superfamily)
MMRRPVALLWLATLAFAGCTGLSREAPSVFTEPARDSLTFWGHSCTYLDVGGLGIVTDPAFEKVLWWRHRFIGSPPADVLRGTRVILISHAHNDHLSPASLERFPAGAQVLCPVPSGRYLKKVSQPVKTMKPGDQFEIDGVRIVAVAVHHPGTRMSLDAEQDGRALGWVIITPEATVFYSGDTDFCSAFADIGWTYAPDIALLNINGHLKPADASRAAEALRAPVVIPTHWGAYGYWIIGGNRRPRDEGDLKRLLGERLHVLNLGESFALEKVSRSTP